MRGMSQQELGAALDITFQQIQKYEKGTNRISASRLIDICDALDVPVTYFFDGYSRKHGASKTDAGLGTRTLRLARYFNDLSRSQQDGVFDLVRTLADGSPRQASQPASAARGTSRSRSR